MEGVPDTGAPFSLSYRVGTSFHFNSLCRIDTSCGIRIIIVARFYIFGGSKLDQMRFILVVFMMVAISAAKGQQSFTTELLGTNKGVSAILSFNSPLFKSEKLSFSQVGRFGINYDGENAMVFMMSNLGYSWTPSVKSTAGALYLLDGGVSPILGL